MRWQGEPVWRKGGGRSERDAVQGVCRLLAGSGEECPGVEGFWGCGRAQCVHRRHSENEFFGEGARSWEGVGDHPRGRRGTPLVAGDGDGAWRVRPRWGTH